MSLFGHALRPAARRYVLPPVGLQARPNLTITHVALQPFFDCLVDLVAELAQAMVASLKDHQTGAELERNACMDFAGDKIDIAYTIPGPTGVYCEGKPNSAGCSPSEPD